MFTDIHCHLLPNMDDGATSLEESLDMARMAVEDGMETIVVTPHQLGGFTGNRGDTIRQQTQELQSTLEAEAISLLLLPGADVRIDDGMLSGIQTGDVLTLGDHGKHVLLELPHELYFPLQPVLDGLRSMGIVGVLSHPERNAGIQRDSQVVARLVDDGCLMQVTAGSLLGTFGSTCQKLAKEMLAEGLVHCIASDAHGSRKRRPLLLGAFHRVIELAGTEIAELIFREIPTAIAAGLEIPGGRMPARRPRRHWFQHKFES